MKKNYYGEMVFDTEEEFKGLMKTSDGETILNCIFTGQLVLTIRDNKFIVMDPGDGEWEFESFEQVCYFMVAAANGGDTNSIKERTLELFPITNTTPCKEV